MPRTDGIRTKNDILRRSWRRSYSSGEPVGTEAIAIAHMEKNCQNFKYPPEGFVTKIEYSLLYNMISEPKLYPEETVIGHISQEDFQIYLPVVSGKNRYQTTTSYGQLSAILALCFENFPPPKDNLYYTSDDCKQQQQQEKPQENIPEKLCHKVLQCVVRHAEEYHLDREQELRDVLKPVESYTSNGNNKAALPFYVGYALAFATGNPLPMLAGALVLTAFADQRQAENENVLNFASNVKRRADIEKTSLLDETDDL